MKFEYKQPKIICFSIYRRTSAENMIQIMDMVVQNSLRSEISTREGSKSLGIQEVKDIKSQHQREFFRFLEEILHRRIQTRSI